MGRQASDAGRRSARPPSPGRRGAAAVAAPVLTAVVSTVAVLVAVLLLPVVEAGAASGDDLRERKGQVDARAEQAREAFEGVSEEAAEAAVALTQAQAQLPAAQEALDGASATARTAQAEDVEMAGRLAAAQESERLAVEALAAGEAEIAETERTIGQIASAAYRTGSVETGLSVALGATSPQDFTDRYAMVDTAMQAQTGALRRLQDQRAVQSHQRTRLEAVRVEVADLREQAAEALDAANAARDEAAARKAEVDALTAQRTQALATIEDQKAAVQRELDELEAQSEQLERELAARAAAEAARRRAAGQAEPVPADSGGALARPAAGRLSSPYGWRTHPIYGTRRMHNGQDFAAACGTPIVAPASGVVVSAGYAGGAGNRTVIDHGIVAGRPLATTYMHLSRFAVRSGRVDRGQVIGYVGTTGASTGCHLHFETRVRGAAVDPVQFF